MQKNDALYQGTTLQAAENPTLYQGTTLQAAEKPCFVSGHDFTRAANDQKEVGL